MAKITGAMVTEIYNGLTRLHQLLPKVGRPRAFAATEQPTTWREVTIGSETFRILTLEDKND